MRSSAFRWLALAALLIGAGLGVWIWTHFRAPQPPPVPSADDAAVVRAVEEARQAVLAQPLSGAAWGNLGMVLYANDFLAQAATCLAQAEVFDPRDYRWAFLHGFILQHGDPAAALARFRTAAKLAPDDAFVALRFADLLLAQGEHDEAVAVYRSSLELQRKWPDAYLGLARSAYMRGDLDETQRQLDRLQFTGYRSKAALLLRAQVLHRQGQQVDADRLALEANRMPDDYVRPDPLVKETIQRHAAGLKGLGVRADALVADGDLDGAIILLNDAARDYGNDYKVYLGLAGAHTTRAARQADAAARQRDYQLAIEAILKAERLAPTNTKVQYYLGFIYLERGAADPAALPRAALYFRKLLAQQPDNGPALFSLGLALARQGLDAQALEPLLTAARYLPEKAEIFVEIGDAFTRLGAPPLAQAYYARGWQLRAQDQSLALKISLVGCTRWH